MSPLCSKGPAAGLPRIQKNISVSTCTQVDCFAAFMCRYAFISLLLVFLGTST